MYTWTESVSEEEFRKRGEAGFTEKGAKQVNWLKEFLPHKFPSAWVMTFGRNADWFVNAPFKTSKDSATSLLVSPIHVKEGRAKGQ
jgi:hypothetical protein